MSPALPNKARPGVDSAAYSSRLHVDGILLRCGYSRPINVGYRSTLSSSRNRIEYSQSRDLVALLSSHASDDECFTPADFGEGVPSPVQAVVEWLSFPPADEKNRDSDQWSLIVEEVTSLFGDRRSSLLRYTMSLGLPIEDAEDIVQEVFLLLFRHLIHRRSRQNLRGWTFRVTHNLALKRARKNQRKNESVVGDFVELALQDPAPNPEEQVSQQRRQANAWAVIRALPERDRCCLTLRAEGLQYREIAEVVGISLGSVALSLSRSLAKLSRVVDR